jgi:membrane fusion protein, multidrug efflux system
MVKDGDVLVEIDPRPYQAALDQAVAKKAQDEASLKNAQLDLVRYAGLAKEDSVSRQKFDTQQATVNELAAQIEGDQASIDNAQTQVSDTTIRSPLTGKTGWPYAQGPSSVIANPAQRQRGAPAVVDRVANNFRSGDRGVIAG